jgi:hypothetical protein
MNLQTLIPFALRVSDSQIVDINDVPRGAHCGCICPSCKTPLIARKGTEKVHHFAHDTKGQTETEQSCDYSYETSIWLMAKQILKRATSMALPDYWRTISDQDKNGNRVSEKVWITSAHHLKFEAFLIDTTIQGVNVDGMIQMGEAVLIIDMPPPGRHQQSDFKRLKVSKNGLVHIEINELCSQLSRSKKGAKSHLQTLSYLLLKDPGTKHWLYHPREEKLLANAGEVLKKRLEKKVPLLQEQHKQREQVREKPASAEFYRDDKKHKPRTEPKPPPQLHLRRRRRCLRCFLPYEAYETQSGEAAKCPRCNLVGELLL